MASENAIEPPTSTVDMELESTKPEEEVVDNGGKRDREEEETENGVESKKPKVENGEEAAAAEDKSVEEVRMEVVAGDGEGKVKEETAQTENIGPVSLGPKTFGTSVEMFDYFYKFLHLWPVNLPVNKYERLVLLDLIKKGHPEPDTKIGSGIASFEVRYHSVWQSRCFFLVREDKSFDDFSFRKCVDHILPLPENMKIKTDVNKALNGGGKKGGGGGGGGRGGGRGHGHGHGGGRGRGRGGRR